MRFVICYVVISHVYLSNIKCQNFGANNNNRSIEFCIIAKGRIHSRPYKEALPGIDFSSGVEKHTNLPSMQHRTEINDA